MMVHPSQRTAPHTDYKDWLDRLVEHWSNFLEQPKGSAVRNELERDLLSSYLARKRRHHATSTKGAEQGEEILREAPGPRAWPLLGSLHLLGGYEVPYAAFSHLAKRYGDVIKMSLGNQRCIVVNGLKNIREVLISKGAHFDGRPNFARFHQLFCGDKENCKYYNFWV